MKREEILITAGEICAFFGVCEETIRRWREKHGLPVRRVGNRLVASKKALEKWAEENTETNDQ